jgi:hypothetical protein
MAIPPKNMQADMAAMDMEMENIGQEKEKGALDFFATGAPKGNFTARSMNGLVDAYNKALVAMGQVGDYPKFSADVTEFPADFVRGIAMLADAAQQAGVPANIDLGVVGTDRDVLILAGIIEKLSKDKTFIKKMQSPETMGSEFGEDMKEEKGKGMGPKPDKGLQYQGGAENGLDALFMGRA